MTLDPTAPDLVSLDLFVSVVELGSVGRAARAHHLSQPAVSARLDDLERRLGLTLLDRGPSGSIPTEDGRLVAGWAEGVLAAARELMTSVEALRASAAGHVRVLASYTIAEYLLPGWLGRFQRAWPEHEVELHVTNSTEVLTELRAGRADIGFIESRADLNDLENEVVARDQLVAVVSPDHAWADAHTIDAEALVTTRLVCREQGSGTRSFLDEAVRAAGLEPPQSRLQLGSTAAVKAAVSSGAGPAVLSTLAVEGDVAVGRLVAAEITGLDLHRPLRMVWPRDRPLSEAADRLRAQLVEHSG